VEELGYSRLIERYRQDLNMPAVLKDNMGEDTNDAAKFIEKLNIIEKNYAEKIFNKAKLPLVAAEALLNEFHMKFYGQTLGP